MMPKIAKRFGEILNGTLGSILGYIVITFGTPVLIGVITLFLGNLQIAWLVTLTIFAVLNALIILFLYRKQKFFLDELIRLEEMIATEELVIHSAEYGVKGVATEDVSQIVKNHIVNGRIEKMPVQNGLLTPGRDLAPGVTKELKVVYSFASTKTVTEKTNGNPGILTLP